MGDQEEFGGVWSGYDQNTLYPCMKILKKYKILIKEKKSAEAQGVAWSYW